MSKELDRLKQELLTAQQEMVETAEEAARVALKQSEKMSKVMRLQRQLDHFDSEFRKKLDEEVAALERDGHFDPEIVPIAGPSEVVDAPGVSELFFGLTENQQRELMDFDFEAE